MSELFNNFGPEYDDSEFEGAEESRERLVAQEELARLALNQPALFEVVRRPDGTIEFSAAEE